MKKYKDNQLGNLKPLLRYIGKENLRQIQKWGIQERTLPEWMLYATEEVGETAEAISEFIYRKGSRMAIIREGTEAITVLLKILDMIVEEEAEILLEKYEKE